MPSPPLSELPLDQQYPPSLDNYDSYPAIVPTATPPAPQFYTSENLYMYQDVDGIYHWADATARTDSCIKPSFPLYHVPAFASEAIPPVRSSLGTQSWSAQSAYPAYQHGDFEEPTQPPSIHGNSYIFHLAQQFSDGSSHPQVQGHCSSIARASDNFLAQASSIFSDAHSSLRRGRTLDYRPYVSHQSSPRRDSRPPLRKRSRASLDDGNYHFGGKGEEEIKRSRLNSPCDLTDQVTRSSNHATASGAFGDIYKGHMSMKGSLIDVAIKTTRMYLEHDEHMPKKMKRFRREITVWWELEHPNILPLLGIINDSSLHPNIPAMVCPWAKNGALTTYLERNNDLPVAKRLSLINNVASGLQYLHSQHIVHGDLSGSNVLVDGDGNARIADFGLSTLLTRLGGSTFATTHQAKGTARWMAPELLDTEDECQITPTTQSDVYSFGSIMLQILTGNTPYYHLPRNEQVILAVGTGMKPKRPDEGAITDHQWTFMQWCWSPAKGDKPRPCSDEIVEFTGKELAHFRV